MSDARQHVVRGPNLTGCGNRPSRTPCHHVERQIGISSRTCGKRSRATESKCLVIRWWTLTHTIVHARPGSFGGV
jgi:hypothetical protein